MRRASERCSEERTANREFLMAFSEFSRSLDSNSKINVKSKAILLLPFTVLLLKRPKIASRKIRFNPIPLNSNIRITKIQRRKKNSKLIVLYLHIIALDVNSTRACWKTAFVQHEWRCYSTFYTNKRTYIESWTVFFDKRTLLVSCQCSVV